MDRQLPVIASVFALAALFPAASCLADKDAALSAEIKMLRASLQTKEAKIRRGRERNAALGKEVKELRKRVHGLEELCRRHGIKFERKGTKAGDLEEALRIRKARKALEESLGGKAGPSRVEIERSPQLPVSGSANQRAVKELIHEAKKRPKSKVLKYRRKIAHEETWIDDGRIARIKGTVVIGVHKQKNKKEDGPAGSVSVGAGSVLEGGKIHVEHGVLKLGGTANQPIIISDIDLSASLIGRLEGTYVVFVNCTFRKGGGWSWARYSSKWIFDRCVFVRSSFHSLGEVAYGIRITNSALIECDLPKRILTVHRQPEDTPADLPKLYRDSWNQIRRCLFVKCKVAPSFVWATDECSFLSCGVTSIDSFKSTHDLKVPLYVPSRDMKFLLHLRKGTRNKFKGKARFINAERSYITQRAGERHWPLNEKGL